MGAAAVAGAAAVGPAVSTRSASTSLPPLLLRVRDTSVRRGEASASESDKEAWALAFQGAELWLVDEWADETGASSFARTSGVEIASRATSSHAVVTAWIER
eukprot:6200109-Pleurochrysis_carterae.AAC.3